MVTDSRSRAVAKSVAKIGIAGRLTARIERIRAELGQRRAGLATCSSLRRDRLLTFNDRKAVGRFPVLLWKHELHLRSDLPIRAEIRFRYVVVRRQLCIHRQLAQMEDFAHTATDRHRPLLTAACLPVDGQDWRAGQVKPALEVIIYERLNQAIVV